MELRHRPVETEREMTFGVSYQLLARWVLTAGDITGSAADVMHRLDDIIALLLLLDTLTLADPGACTEEEEEEEEEDGSSFTCGDRRQEGSGLDSSAGGSPTALKPIKATWEALRGYGLRWLEDDSYRPFSPSDDKFTQCHIAYYGARLRISQDRWLHESVLLFPIKEVDLLRAIHCSVMSNRLGVLQTVVVFIVWLLLPPLTAFMSDEVLRCRVALVTQQVELVSVSCCLLVLVKLFPKWLESALPVTSLSLQFLLSFSFPSPLSKVEIPVKNFPRLDPGHKPYTSVGEWLTLRAICFQAA
ncbi:hypothetical protein INR49_019944, partial [Caranx melampygus]